jgi:hypothetical protein
LNGAEHIESIVLNENEAERTIPTDYFIPFWSCIKLGQLKLGLEIEKMLLKSIIPWITRLIFRHCHRGREHVSR